MNYVLMFVLLSFCAVRTDPAKVVDAPSVETALEADDPALVSLCQAWIWLNDSLLDAVAKTPHPESSSKVEKLLDKIRKVEAAMVARQIMLRWSRRPIPLAPAPSRDLSIMVL